MSRFLLIGPPKIGKSVAANRIANALGCAHIKYEWDGIDALPDSVLIVINYGSIKPQPLLRCKPPLWNLVAFTVESSGGLQALVEALEFKQVTPKQFQSAKKLADIAAWLDGYKNYIPQAQRQEAIAHIETLHDYAMSTAGYRVAEIYSQEERAHW